MEIKYWTIFFLMVAAQGFLVGLLLLFRSKTWNSVSIHLSVLIFSFTVCLGLWVGFWNNWNYQFPSLSFIHNAVPLLFGPSLYLHLKSLNGRVLKIDLLHYTPFLIVALYFFPYAFMPPETKMIFLEENTRNPNLISSSSIYFQNISLIFYQILLNRLAVSDAKKAKWSAIIKKYFLVFTSVFIICSIFFDFISYNLYLDVIGALIMVFSIYSIGYMSFNRLSIFHRLDLSKTIKYNRSALTEKHAEIIVEKLQSFLINNKTFKSSEMTLVGVSKSIEIPSHYISESLNKYKGINYSDFINHLRVEEAKDMLRSPDYENLKVESIGYAVGFNSKTTFYNAFKKDTGKSPANYQKGKVAAIYTTFLF